jgi:hypothetical protein
MAMTATRGCASSRRAVVAQGRRNVPQITAAADAERTATLAAVEGNNAPPV